MSRFLADLIVAIHFADIGFAVLGQSINWLG
jgi:hypothetical protein